MGKKLERGFFERDARTVARELLGKILVRIVDGKELRSKVVETEAYFGKSDPASKASRGNGDLSLTMSMRAGTVLVYGVHGLWLMNFVTGDEGKHEAVLIRAIEPLNFEGKGQGPGLLTKALKVDKSFHKKDIENGNLFVEDNNENFDIVDSYRIGIREDLPEKLRFYIKDNKHISKK